MPLMFYMMPASDIEPGDIVTVWGERGAELVDRDLLISEVLPFCTADGLQIEDALRLMTVDSLVEVLVLGHQLLGVERSTV